MVTKTEKSGPLSTRPPTAPTLPLKSRGFGTPRWQFFDKTYTDCRCARKGLGGGVRASAGAAPVSRGVRSLGAAGRGGDVADRRGPLPASPASAIEASSAVTAKKLGGSVW